MRDYKENNDLINVSHLTKDFGNKRGVFDISFNVKHGEIFGIIGESGAGKSTILRILMGFIKPSIGICEIENLNCYYDAEQIKEFVSYVSGEFSIFDFKSGSDFLKFISELNNDDVNDPNDLIKDFQLDIKAYPKRMSKGMKQKMALVTCFMKKSNIYLLDEPSIGLDPLMREELIKLIKYVNSQGATVVITTNDYEEIKKLCNRVLVLSKGKAIDVINLNEILSPNLTYMTVELLKENDVCKIPKKWIIDSNGRVVKLCIPSNHLGYFFKLMSEIDIELFETNEFDLEHFVARRLEQTNEKAPI